MRRERKILSMLMAVMMLLSITFTAEAFNIGKAVGDAVKKSTSGTSVQIPGGKQQADPNVKMTGNTPTVAYLEALISYPLGYKFKGSRGHAVIGQNLELKSDGRLDTITGDILEQESFEYNYNGRPNAEGKGVSRLNNHNTALRWGKTYDVVIWAEGFNPIIFKNVEVGKAVKGEATVAADGTHEKVQILKDGKNISGAGAGGFVKVTSGGAPLDFVTILVGPNVQLERKDRTAHIIGTHQSAGMRRSKEIGTYDIGTAYSGKVNLIFWKLGYVTQIRTVTLPSGTAFPTVDMPKEGGDNSINYVK